MNFSDFCKAFYTGKRETTGLNGVVGQKEITRYLLRLALGDEADQMLANCDKSLAKWYSGERNVNKGIFEKAIEKFDEQQISRTILEKLNDQFLGDLLFRFGVTLEANEKPDKQALAGTITKQFKLIVEGYGFGKDIFTDAYYCHKDISEFPVYIENSYKKFSKLKTLLYTSEERPFDEFFVCNHVGFGSIKYDKYEHTVQDVTLEKLRHFNSCVLLEGMGGIGKTMMMRHLFLESNCSYEKTGLLPIMVTLREFGSPSRNLLDIIVDSAHRFDTTFSTTNVKQLLADGKCQLLLDGLDEIKPDDIGDFLRQLDVLMDTYPKVQCVMSTRKISDFVGLPRFMIAHMLPFDKQQSLELIDKLEYCPEEPKIKQQFRNRLDDELFDTHYEFVTNPLLLTLMLMNYRRFAEIPERKYLFYEQAYQTLLQRHDADKLAYKRVFLSVNDTSDFTLVFREFCAKSYRKGDYEFDEKSFSDYFQRLKSVKRLNLPQLTVENFLRDACHSACLMYKDGQSYHFLHRSFQEYFFAVYYSCQDDETICKLGYWLNEINFPEFDDEDAFDMLYDLAPDRVEKCIFIPFLEKIFDSGNSSEEYWRFLKAGYGHWNYMLDNPKAGDEYKIDDRFKPFGTCVMPSSGVLSYIMKTQKIELCFNVKDKRLNLAYPELRQYVVFGERLQLRDGKTIYLPSFLIDKDEHNVQELLADEEAKSRIVCDNNDKPIEFGYVYTFDFEQPIADPEKYPKIVKLWNNPNSGAYRAYGRTKKYYQTLKESYDSQNDLDNDDF